MEVSRDGRDMSASISLPNIRMHLGRKAHSNKRNWMKVRGFVRTGAASQDLADQVSGAN
jgi:hypothetical protein